MQSYTRTLFQKSKCAKKLQISTILTIILVVPFFHSIFFSICETGVALNDYGFLWFFGLDTIYRFGDVTVVKQFCCTFQQY